MVGGGEQVARGVGECGADGRVEGGGSSDDRTAAVGSTAGPVFCIAPSGDDNVRHFLTF